MSVLIVVSADIGRFDCGSAWVKVGVGWITLSTPAGPVDRVSISAVVGSHMTTPAEGLTMSAAIDVDDTIRPFLVDAGGKAAPRWLELFDYLSGKLPKKTVGKLSAVCGHAAKFGKRIKV